MVLNDPLEHKFKSVYKLYLDHCTEARLLAYSEGQQWQPCISPRKGFFQQYSRYSMKLRNYLQSLLSNIFVQKILYEVKIIAITIYCCRHKLFNLLFHIQLLCFQLHVKP